MSNLEKRIRHLEKQMKWKDDQISVLIDYVSRILGHPEYLQLQEDIDTVYRRSIELPAVQVSDTTEAE
jgi:hypothetical protein